MMECEYYLETLDELTALYGSNRGIEIINDREINLGSETKKCTILKGKFESGWIVTTISVECWIKEPQTDEERKLRMDFVHLCLMRHLSGDWGIQCVEDFLTNEQSLKLGNRIMSVYDTSKDYFLKDNCTIWIITEWDRSVTTILFPSDY